MIHILIGHEAAKKLEAAFELDENLKGPVVVLRDTLGIGPIKPATDESWKVMRTTFWKTIRPTMEEEVADEEILLQTIATAEQEEEPVCIWLAPCVSDYTAYYWVLPYFKNYPGMLHTISILGLPFLNEKGQLFYPINFSEVLPKEFLKTKRLLKEVSPAEFEVDGEEWMRLSSEPHGVRVYDGGKKISSKPLEHFDSIVMASLSTDFTKASKVVHEAMKKIQQTVADYFIEWRLRELVASGQLSSQGDTTKLLKDFEVKKPGGPDVPAEAAENSEV